MTDTQLVEQLLDTIASDRRDDAKLGKMGPDRINHRGLLANEQMPRAMIPCEVLTVRTPAAILNLPGHFGTISKFAHKVIFTCSVALQRAVRERAGRSPALSGPTMKVSRLPDARRAIVINRIIVVYQEPSEG